MDDPVYFFAQAVASLVPMLLCLTVHEWAHARTALSLGDDTAERQGRCTLSPLPHIDLLGTIVLPLVLTVATHGRFSFGWAKPVPVNPMRFRHGVNMRFGMMLTALAGPAANVVLAVACTILLWAIARVAPSLLGVMPDLTRMVVLTVVINVMLACFNLLPIPPLDGSRLADYFMPTALRRYWEPIYSGGPMALIVVLVVMQMSNFSMFDLPVRLVLQLLGHIVQG